MHQNDDNTQIWFTADGLVLVEVQRCFHNVIYMFTILRLGKNLLSSFVYIF